MILLVLCSTTNLVAQKDVIQKKDSTEIRCKVLVQTPTIYTYAYVNGKNKVKKSTILLSEVENVTYTKFDKNIVEDKIFTDLPPVVFAEEPVKSYQYSAALGLNLSNILEFNAPSGPDKNSFSATSALDLGLDYYKEGSRFAMTNELHWTLGIQKDGISGSDRIQRVTDDLLTLHDFSYTFSKNSKWNANLIVKNSTSIFTIYDGDYFKDYNNNGKIQGFLNPYQVILSPGIKYQPNEYFRLSLSPYSVSLYGLTSQQIANTGFYTQTFDSFGDYDLFVFDQLGAELNIWYDRKYKKWLEMQYRLGFSSDYLTDTDISILMDGMFITKVRIFKNLFITHRAILKGDLLQTPLKPYYKQTILLSFAKSF
ncbi:hypothetical protein [Flavobacterium nackdongense]|uniref:DUF3078 domain-containing protein n=1 Tax=Flavobacterium nackdongense TaxID=2547394 RepID=A0A4P6Y616_9FLAO|nr:hypothetical protein [Flavobacterium nackdongense]QBN17706.1 hypothetical protein E1750_02440 [Flavobacterium nackdongense]